MTNNANDIQREIKVKGQKLGTVTSFKYLGAVVSDDGSKPEVLSRIAQATAALKKLKPIWRDNNISLGGGRVVRWCWVNFQCRGVLQFGYSRARAYCARSRCGWGLFGHFYSPLSFLSPFSLSLGDGSI